MTFSFVKQAIEARKQSSLLRQRHCIEVQEQQYIRVGGKQYINFSSNDYLGLNNHPTINDALYEGAKRFGASSTSSSLITGYSYAHQKLEETICSWLNKERCLLFSSGFAANLGALQALKVNDVALYLDKLSHASLIDGARLSDSAGRSKVSRFKHNDVKHLSQLLAKGEQDKLVVTESIFSMDGDLAPLEKIRALANKHGAKIYLDDAHGIGVLGDQGQGGASLINSDITMATFGKAIATQGAVLACDHTLFDYLVNFSREYIYSTAISPAIAWATIASIELIQQSYWRRDKVKELSHLFKNELDSSIRVLPTDSSIHAIVVGEQDKAMKLSEQLKAQGFWLTAIRPPTVPKGTSRLRVTICQNHNAKDIIRLAREINKAMM
ncbi:aminotransferase class I/II-fold pyridoxal phosphate-dependent enzyme [Thalassotalea sp. LPB0316]|uniref:aminotransferase class I/II-fold pyridoxal phosphate-dependent enzyme n=1 Tax=Thalassotalea sp. LPB0316 TaxID=2769490 RepID=UPI001D056B69|nr:8-amino-7-oxononanoate synthase [Thalassotalea sp. LPB0316]